MPRAGPKRMRYNNPNVGKAPGLSKADRQEILEHFRKTDCPARHFRMSIESIDALDEDNRRLRREILAAKSNVVHQAILRDAVDLGLKVLGRFRSEQDDFSGDPRICTEAELDVEVAFLRMFFARDQAWPHVSPQMSLMDREQGA